MKAIGIIPARYGSKRLPGKPLAMISGKPMIQWVYERASRSRSLDRVIVATDDVRIMRTVWKFGGQAMLTPKSLRSGTDRVAEASKKMGADIVINIQGDEPLIRPDTIDKLVAAMRKDSRLLMATAAAPLRDAATAATPSVVKVVSDRFGNALYFSRAPIPFYRNEKASKKFYQHLGIYAYRKNFLLKFAKWKSTALETAESLEQLRALERGIRIRVVEVRGQSIGVDTKQDLERVKKLL